MKIIFKKLVLRTYDDSKLDLIIQNQQTIMAKFDEVIERINQATNGIAAKITAATNEIATLLANSGISVDEENSALAKLGEAASALEGIAADPKDPVPAEEEPTPAIEPTEEETDNEEGQPA